MLTAILASSVASAMVGAIEEHKSFELSISGLPNDEQDQFRKRRSAAIEAATIERRHREIVEATRQRSTGIMGFLFGFILGRS